VLLYFTADWCLTCKVNEKIAIERAEVTQAFAAKKVAVMVGDWTQAAIPRSAASSPRTAARACPSISGIRPGVPNQRNCRRC
jgi:thiol:disulfide interchange protein